MAKTVKIGPYSAYAIAVAAGYQGTEQEWLASLVGPQGSQGSSVTGAQINENGHLILTVHDPKTGTDTQIDAGSIDTTNAAQAVLAQIQQAGQDAVGSVSESVQQAANSASAAAQSATEAQGSAASAKQDADNAAASVAVVSENAQNLQNVTDNLAAIQDAAGNAQAAAQSAAEAAQSAQQALGFRTFFGAVSPDANGDLDPSRTMTTAAAQASWTVKSKGDRIQSVQVNGQAGGASLVKFALPQTGWQVNADWSPGDFLAVYIRPAFLPATPKTNGNIYCTRLNQIPSTAPANEGIFLTSSLYVSIRKSRLLSPDAEGFNAWIAKNNLIAWYEPNDASDATGLYIPIQAQGHEYRCQCLPITEALSAGDNVQSNVPSEFDASVTFDGSEDEKWTQTVTSQSGIYRYGIQGNSLAIKPMPGVNAQSGSVMSNKYPAKSANDVSTGETGISINTTPIIYICDPNIANLEDWKSSLQQHPITIFYKSASASGLWLFVELETHANGNTYAHDLVELEAVPYTSDDSGKTPGTYEVSSQDGTTVQVSLKAMQDGGDAATLDGHTWADIQKLISDAVTSAVALSQ